MSPKKSFDIWQRAFRQMVFERLNTVRKKKAQWDEHSQQKL